MSARCVCGHIKALHRKGVCMARIRVCGCSFYEDEKTADRPSGSVKTTIYDGIYANRKWTA